eukprot:Skav236686  [mRNA]  locus=scaffold847:117527:121802:+ [translate_table: standard]
MFSQILSGDPLGPCCTSSGATARMVLRSCCRNCPRSRSGRKSALALTRHPSPAPVPPAMPGGLPPWHLPQAPIQSHHVSCR